MRWRSQISNAKLRKSSGRTHAAGCYDQAFAEQTLVLISAFLQDVAVLSETLEKKLGKAVDG